MTSGRLTAPQTAGLALVGALLVAGSLLGGRALERRWMPQLRGGGGDGESAVQMQRRSELEDRVVVALRGGSHDDVQRAIDALRDAGSARSLEPSAIVARRAEWWRHRIAGAGAHRDHAIERARSKGFTDAELDLEPRTPEHEVALVQLIAEAPASDEEARGWAATLSRSQLTPEAARAILERLEVPETSRQASLVLALSGTRSPEVETFWRRLLVEPRRELALRREAATYLLVALGEGAPLGELESVVIDPAQPPELQVFILDRLRWQRDAPDEVREMLRQVAMTPAASEVVRQHAIEAARMRADPAIARDFATLASDASAPMNVRVAAATWWQTAAGSLEPALAQEHRERFAGMAAAESESPEICRAAHEVVEVLDDRRREEARRAERERRREERRAQQPRPRPHGTSGQP